MKQEVIEYIKVILEKEGINSNKESVDAFIIGQKVGLSEAIGKLFRIMEERYGMEIAKKAVPEGLYDRG